MHCSRKPPGVTAAAYMGLTEEAHAACALPALRRKPEIADDHGSQSSECGAGAHANRTRATFEHVRRTRVPRAHLPCATCPLATCHVPTWVAERAFVAQLRLAMMAVSVLLLLHMAGRGACFPGRPARFSAPPPSASADPSAAAEPQEEVLHRPCARTPSPNPDPHPHPHPHPQPHLILTRPSGTSACKPPTASCA